MKNLNKVEAGRLGGIKGGKSRANVLSKERRAEIARIAATVRWSKYRSIGMRWQKKLSSSDAQETVPVGSKMPFLRFTKEGNPFDHTTYFREQFFKNLVWKPCGADGEEKAEITIDVTILGESLGLRKMVLDHKPSRAKNHSAPTTHLNYDHATRYKLESLNLKGYTVVVENKENRYFLYILA